MKVKRVIVLHGLYMSGLVMRPLCSRLEESGVKVLNLTYNTRDPNRDAIFTQVDEFISDEPSALVCHSMGGLVARAYLEANSAPSHHVEKVITLGTPHTGSHIAEKMQQKGFELLLKNSVDQIDYIARRAEIIATAAHEQSSMSEEIAHSIDSIKQAAIDNAAGADQVSAASMELDQLSKQLQKITNGFRLR